MPVSDIEVYFKKRNFGLKSINISLSITPALMPGLVKNQIHWALALNLALLIIPDTHIINFQSKVKTF